MSNNKKKDNDKERTQGGSKLSLGSSDSNGGWSDSSNENNNNNAGPTNTLANSSPLLRKPENLNIKSKQNMDQNRSEKEIPPLKNELGSFIVPEAEDIITDKKIKSDPLEANVFRYVAFGRNREQKNIQNLYQTNQQDHTSDAETDGQYDSDIDQDGLDQIFFKDKKNRCKHRSIHNYQCKDCKYLIEKFGTYFDTGSIPNYLRMCQAQDTEELVRQLVRQLGRELDVIYQSFEGTNIIQMRDYMQTILGRSLIQQVKHMEEVANSYKYRLLPTEAIYSDSIRHVKRYEKYRNDFKEQKKAVMSSKTLFIDSNFESGNIEKVFTDRDPKLQEYHLFMNADTNTRGHQQWFYFRVRNMRRGTKYKFNIWNFTKPKSLFGDGMKPMWFSKKKKQSMNIESDEEAWEFIPNENFAEPIKYTRSELRRPYEPKGLFEKLFAAQQESSAPTNASSKGKSHAREKSASADPSTGKEPGSSQQTTASNTLSATPQYVKKFADRAPYYCLSFTLTFDQSNDTVYIAYSRPYKYSKIILDVVATENRLMEQAEYPEQKRCEAVKFDKPADINVNGLFQYQRRNLCVTLSGLPMPVLTISACKNIGKPFRRREAIIITSRVHPGESNASFVFQGILEMLTGNDPNVQQLRENFVFTLFPCLNPDGVVRGNYRSSFAGVDLNRQWIQPDESVHPEIYHTKREIERIFKDKPVLLFCDLHGHSRKKNSFIYGCNRAADGGFNSWTKVRLFPRILASLNHVFDLTSCRFKVEKGKLGTGRVVVWREFEVTNSFTLENSFHGFDYGDDFKPFEVRDFKALGQDIITSLSEYQRILMEIQKELQITKGWLKPKTLLAVTGKTAQEGLKQEARDKKKQLERKSFGLESDSQVGTQKPPIGSSSRSRLGVGFGSSAAKPTLQNLVDKYMSKESGSKPSDATEKKQKEQANDQPKIGNKQIEAKQNYGRSPSNKRGGGMVLSSKVLANVKSKKNDSVERSQDLSSQQQNSHSQGSAFQLVVPKRSNSREPVKSSRHASKDSRYGDNKDDDANYQKKKEFMLKCIVRIQSFARMIVARNIYIEMQTKIEENKLRMDKDKFLTSLSVREGMSIDQRTITESVLEASRSGTQLSNQQQSNNKASISDKYEYTFGRQGRINNHNSIVKNKYMDSLTLQVIPSETIHQQKAFQGVKVRNSSERDRQQTLTTILPEQSQIEESIASVKHNESVEIGRNQNTIMTEISISDAQSVQARKDSFNQSKRGRQMNNLDWRQYFDVNELIQVFDKIQKGSDPTEDEKEDDQGSDSCPSEDNFDLSQLYDIIYCQRNKTAIVMADKEKAEKKFERDFSKFAKQVQRKLRDASRESSKMCNIHMHMENHNCEICMKRAQQLAKKSQDLTVKLSNQSSNSNQVLRSESMGQKKLKIKSKGMGNILLNNPSMESSVQYMSQQPSKNTSIDHSESNIRGATSKTFKIKKIQVYKSPVADKIETPTTVTNAGGRSSTPVKQSANIKNRRLRSQDAKQQSMPEENQGISMDEEEYRRLLNNQNNFFGGNQVKIAGGNIKLKQNSFLPILGSKVTSHTVEKQKSFDNVVNDGDKEHQYDKTLDETKKKFQRLIQQNNIQQKSPNRNLGPLYTYTRESTSPSRLNDSQLDNFKQYQTYQNTQAKMMQLHIPDIQNQQQPQQVIPADDKKGTQQQVQVFTPVPISNKVRRFSPGYQLLNQSEEQHKLHPTILNHTNEQIFNQRQKNLSIYEDKLLQREQQKQALLTQTETRKQSQEKLSVFAQTQGQFSQQQIGMQPKTLRVAFKSPATRNLQENTQQQDQVRFMRTNIRSIGGKSDKGPDQNQYDNDVKQFIQRNDKTSHFAQRNARSPAPKIAMRNFARQESPMQQRAKREAGNSQNASNGRTVIFRQVPGAGMLQGGISGQQVEQQQQPMLTAPMMGAQVRIGGAGKQIKIKKAFGFGANKQKSINTESSGSSDNEDINRQNAAAAHNYFSAMTAPHMKNNLATDQQQNSVAARSNAQMLNSQHLRAPGSQNMMVLNSSQQTAAATQNHMYSNSFVHRGGRSGSRGGGQGSTERDNRQLSQQFNSQKAALSQGKLNIINSRGKASPLRQHGSLGQGVNGNQAMGGGTYFTGQHKRQSHASPGPSMLTSNKPFVLSGQQMKQQNSQQNLQQ